jgi:hypothetical protein
MHNDFTDKHTDIICSYDLYRKVVKEMNISFTKLGNEECEQCEEFSIHNVSHSKENFSAACDICQKWQKHITKAEVSRNDIALIVTGQLITILHVFLLICKRLLCCQEWNLLRL